MKFVRNTLLGLYVNLFIFVLLLANLFWGLTNNSMGDWKQWLLLTAIVISSILNLVFAVKNITSSYLLYKNGEYKSLRKYMKVIKLGAIPFFILNFVIYSLIFIIFFGASRGLIFFTPIPAFFLIPIFFTYLSVISTSSYGIGFVVTMYKDKRKLIIHILLQLCFVLDVIDTIVLLMKYKVEQINE